MDQRYTKRLVAIFLAQMYGIDLSITQQITLLLVLMLTSKGIAGVPGVSFVVLLATLGTVGIPAEGLAFIAGIDRILDMARTAVNVVGNSLATVVMSKWEGQYDDIKRTSLFERDIWKTSSVITIEKALASICGSFSILERSGMYNEEKIWKWCFVEKIVTENV